MMLGFRFWMILVGVPLLVGVAMYFQFGFWHALGAWGLTGLCMSYYVGIRRKRMTFWHKLLQQLALRCVKKQLQAAVLDVCILEDKAHLDLYSGEELDQTLERLCKRYESVSAGLAALARGKYTGEDRYLNEIISTYCSAWCWIDVALRGEFADDVFASQHWIMVNNDSNAAYLREIILKKRYGEPTGDEECSSTQ